VIYTQVAKIKPAVNQVESHPFLSQRKLMTHMDKYGIKLMAYSPLGGSPTESNAFVNADVRKDLFENEIIKLLAIKYRKSIGQILIKYQLARGNIVIPKSVTKSRIEENINIFDFDLTDEEVQQLDSLNKNLRFVHLSGFAKHKNYPFNDEY